MTWKICLDGGLQMVGATTPRNNNAKGTPRKDRHHSPWQTYQWEVWEVRHAEYITFLMYTVSSSIDWQPILRVPAPAVHCYCWLWLLQKCCKGLYRWWQQHFAGTAPYHWEVNVENRQQCVLLLANTTGFQWRGKVGMGQNWVDGGWS